MGQAIGQAISISRILGSQNWNDTVRWSTRLVPRLCLQFQQSLRNLKDVYPLSHYDRTCHLLHGEILSVHPNASAFEVCVWPAGAACYHMLS